jgi:hypothetical protein
VLHNSVQIKSHTEENSLLCVRNNPKEHPANTPTATLRQSKTRLQPHMALEGYAPTFPLENSQYTCRHWQ